MLSIHRSQTKLFARQIKAIQRQFGKLPEAAPFLAVVAKIDEHLQRQATAAAGLFAQSASLPEGNRSSALMEMPMKHAYAYDYLTAKRLLAEQLGDLDEWKPALKAYGLLSDAARPFKDSDEKRWAKVSELGWHFTAGKCQLDALARQADAIAATEEALMRSYGIRFWQGHKRVLRWTADH